VRAGTARLCGSRSPAGDSSWQETARGKAINAAAITAPLIPSGRCIQCGAGPGTSAQSITSMLSSIQQSDPAGSARFCPRDASRSQPVTRIGDSPRGFGVIRWYRRLTENGKIL
jgi:hypothetical protein